ncbi:MAG: SusD/RagB family nutrient-binding outer membrane lipoprotein [Saprospiraceae bacterium]|nr:SusD/RagB family nutrient-binding outer membrane lipoprotein [Saprospiraceae bacterium]
MKNLFKSISLIAFAFLFSTCSLSDFGDVNKNPNATTVPVTSALLTNVLAGLGGWTQGMNEGLYAQYFSESQYTDASLYSLQQINFTGNYSGAMYDLQNIINNNTDEDTKNEVTANGSNANQIAVAKILLTYLYMHQTDRWGDVPYSTALTGDAKPTYDTQADIYKGFFSTLKSAIAQFDNGLAAQGDILFGGDKAKWKKFANSLRLVLAMRLSKVDPASGKTEFSAAFSDAAGYLSSAADDVTLFYPGATYKNPWYVVYDGRKDYSISDVMVTALKNLNDSRLQQFGTPNAKGEVKGIPYGLTRDAAINYTNANADWSLILAPKWRSQTAPVVVLAASQVLLPLAEAIQRGWVTGDKNKFYADGIKASFERWGISDASTINTYVNSNSVALDGSSSDLEKINLQKWIAIYPDGRSGWTEWRRTGTPTLTPTPQAVSASKQIPRRFVYPTVEYNLNGENLSSAVGRVPGGDTQDGRVWWDKQ